MRFGVLGPLAVWTEDGRPVRVPEVKVRALLADLLAHEGRTVSADTLVEDLWGAKPPSNPTGVLQNKVWQLRRVLEAAETGARELVVSASRGYRLRVDPEELDAGRFHSLVDSARKTADPRLRAALLADGLSVWRGQAFADFADEEFTRAVAGRLEEQRLTALEEQAEARLELGEHALLADELGDLVALHPLRERLRAAHIRALYLAGRQGAALSSYADLQRQLADELGVDPGPQLAALHRAILHQDPALQAVPTPATSAARPSSAVPAVPAPLGGLIGRDGAIRELRALLETNRLVTLTGAGGVGKTQLALAVAAQAGEGFPGGIRLAEFAALDAPAAPAADSASSNSASAEADSAAEVYEAVGRVLGVREDTTTSPGPGAEPPPVTDRFVRALGEQPSLLVLDNCEHLAGPVARLTEDLLRAAPQLRVLATSQEPLGIAGEHLHAVPPLRTPADGAVPQVADLVRDFSAVELFVARATAAAPGFALDETNAAAVAAICRRLDGIPLALEMAAVRVRSLGVHELVTRLDDRFRVLSAGTRGAPARHRTLRAVIDWSWQLLGAPEQAVLRRLSAFSDGASLAAAEEVCAGDDLDRADVLDLLARLVDCSLVVMTDTRTGPRYRLLESVAAYSAERLAEAGESAEFQRRHSDHFTTLAERADPRLRGHGQRDALRLLDTEAANLRTALENSARLGDDPERTLRLATALMWFWHLRGRVSEARRSLTLALSAGSGAAPRLRARAVAALGVTRLLLGDGGDPVAEYRTALQPYDALDEPAERARMEWLLGSNLYGIGDLTPSEQLVNSALAAFRSYRDRWGIAAALASRSFQAKLRGDFAALRRDGERSLELFRELGDQWGQLQAMAPLATLAEVMGDYDRAGRLYRDGLRMAEDLGLWPEVSFKLSGLGRTALLTGDLARAREYHERARRLAVEQSDRFGEQFAEIGLALGARRAGELDRAEAHLHSVLDLHRQMGYEPGAPPLILDELGFIAEHRGDLAEARRLHLDGYATARTTGDPRTVALALEGLAGVDAADGAPARAARLLGCAAAARASVGAPLPEGERFDVDRITRRAQEALGKREFDTELSRGRDLTPDDCLSQDPVS